MVKYLIGDIEMGGFGAMFARRKLIMQIAEAFNRLPVFRFTNYVYEDPFEPLATTLQDLKKEKINEVRRFNFVDNNDKAVFFDFNSYWLTNNCTTYQCWRPQDTTYLQYSGKLYNSLKMTPSFTKEIESTINKIKAEWNIVNFNNIIGLHYRKGDKIAESSYLSEDFVINFIKERFDIKKYKVFIASDDHSCILSLIKKFPEIEFIYDKSEKRLGNPNLSNQQQILNDPTLKHGETITFMKNIEIFKNCLCVIGSYNVQLTKISGSINSYLKNKDSLFLINPNNNNLETLGTSLETS